MDATLNLGQWKSMENSWADMLNQNPPVQLKVKIEIEYGDVANPKRPTRFKVTETRNGMAQETTEIDNF